MFNEQFLNFETKSKKINRDLEFDFLFDMCINIENVYNLSELAIKDNIWSEYFHTTCLLNPSIYGNEFIEHLLCWNISKN